MEQPKEKPTLEQIMKLVDQLTADEREQVLEQLKMTHLQNSIQLGIEQAERGDVIDGEIVLAELRHRAEKRLNKS